MIKAILFDLDQTLLDRTYSLRQFINWQVNFFQLVPQAKKSEFIEKFIQLDANGTVWKDVVYRKLIQEFAIKTYTEQLLLRSYIQDFNKFCCSFADVDSVILKLHQAGYLLGLISNGQSPFQEHNFQALGLAEFFSTVLVSEAVALRKPDAAIFHLACEKLKVQAEQCIFIGDNENADIRGANAVGMKSIFFNPDAKIVSADADANLNDYANLWEIIQKIQSKGFISKIDIKPKC
ncbi:HAD family hydrolase [Acinetobacter sp. YH12207]|uniref:HAD family hydrolase n=1 Tax=Acinetobacter TaxID=469 RepID=UPI0035A17ADB